MELKNCYYYGISSLEKYFRQDSSAISFCFLEGSIVDIAKNYDNISYPGVEGIDAVVTDEDKEVLYSCYDSVLTEQLHPFNVYNFLLDKGRNVFIDRSECYRSLREKELSLTDSTGFSSTLTLENLLEAAALVAQFGFKPDPHVIKELSRLSETLTAETPSKDNLPSSLLQRVYLTAVVSGEFAAAGLKLLRDFGAVETLWPELNALIGLDQAKEFHPEGDAWDHSLETLYHRKTKDAELAFALLLHDVGKPLASREDGNRFHNHAQIGRKAAERFLRRLKFPEAKIEKICFLIENHMLPAAIKTLPPFRTEKAMLNPYFPLLLEVYRCDLLSSFNGPEGYYDACKVYRKFIKNKKNPFRDSAGKKLYRLYVD